MIASTSPRSSRLFRNFIARGAVLAAALTLSASASADITFSGAVNPNPSGGTVDFLDVGTGAPGTFAVDAGSTFTANSLSVATGGTGCVTATDCTVTITGTGAGNLPQTVINLLGPPDLSTIRSPLIVGQWGTGTMTVSQGAIINGLGAATCVPNLCNTFIGNFAGSSGTLTLTGPGTTASLGGGFFAGFGVAFSTAAGDSFTLGTPGGTATGVVNVQNGAALNTYNASLASTGTSGANLGTEQGVAHATVDGTNSIWTVSANPVTGATAGIGMANGLHTTATLDVTNGGQVSIIGANSYLQVGNGGNATVTLGSGGSVSVANLAIGNQTTGAGTVIVGDGVGQSVLTATSSVGVGNSSTATSQLTINAGGYVNVTGANGLGIAGASGSSGVVLVSGGQLDVLGTNAGLGVGNGGNGTLTVVDGGHVNAVNLGLGGSASSVGTMTVGNGNGQSVVTVSNSMGVGNGSTATSTLTINAGGAVNVTGGSGLGIANSVGSNGSVVVNGGQLSVSGSSSAIGIGNQGTGSLTIQNGGSVTMAGQNFGITVGGSGSGSLFVNTGSTLTTESLTVGGGPSSTGVVNIVGTSSGPQTVVTLNGPASATNGVNPLQVGNWGNGTMTVSDGAIVNVAVGNVNCGVAGAFCNNFVGNAAGSTGKLTLTGAGTTANLAGGFTVGGASVFTQASSGFTFGTPGGTTHATLEVKDGATLNTYQTTLSAGPGGAAPLGTEQTIATVTIDNGTWNVTRNPVTGAQAQILVSTRSTASATVDVKNGGQIVITGDRLNPATDSSVPGLTLTGTVNFAGGSSTFTVDGAGSAVVINGDTGFINLGRNGGTAILNVQNGAKIFSDDPNGLVNMNVARAGSHATLNVDGAGSQLTLSGVCGVNTGCDANGAFINIGRDAGSSAFVNVTNGGKILVSDGGQAAINGSTGFWLGRDANSSGTMLVSGAGTTVTVEQTGAGTALPLIMVGRAGSGQMTITDHASVVVNGPSERDFIVGGAAGGTGVLTVSNGAQITTSWFTTGNNGGMGTSTIDNATALINGVAINPADNSLFGGSVRVGRGTGSVGTLNLINGAQLIIDTATDGSNINLGGTSAGLGGNGTINMSGASSISFVGTGATPSVNIGHSGTGLFTMTGDGVTTTLTLPDDGSIVLGNRAPGGGAPGGDGTLQLGGNSRIDTGYLTVGNNGQGHVTMTGGTLGVHALDPDHTSFLVGGNNGSAGTFSQSGGVVNADGGLTLGWQAGSSGTYMLTGGTLNSGSMSVGDRGTGLFANSDPGLGTVHNVSGNLIIAGDTTSNGSSYTITGNNARTNINFAPGGVGPTDPPGLNGIDPITNQPRPAPNGALGVGIGGVGTFTQGAANFSDPTNAVAVAGDLVVGVFAGGVGTYTLNTGTLTVGGKLVVGAVSQGANVFTQNGGSVTVTGNAFGNPNYVGLGGNDFSGSLIVGGGINDLGGGTGTYVLHGGTVTASLVQVGQSGKGTLNQTGGTVNVTTLSLGNCGGCGGVNSSGTYNLSGTGALTADSATIGGFGHGVFTQSGTSTATIAGDLTVGSGPELPAGPANNPVREGIVSVSGGTLSVGGNMIVGAGNAGTVGGFPGEPGGKGSVTQSGGSVTISGGLTIGQGSGAGASAGGTGEYALKGGTLTVTGQTIVGGGGADSSLGGIGTLFVLDGATLNAGTLLGIGHDGTASNGAKGVVILDGGANIFATNVKIGAGGCLGGNGTVHGSVVMDGETIGDCDTGITPTITATGNGSGTGVGIEGFLKPGRSPGTIIFDGEFQFLSGTIVLDVQSCGLDCFLTDKIIFTDGTIPDLMQAKIEYVFLGDTDPNAFADAPNDPWNLDTFFKTIVVDAGGNSVVTGISALGPLDEQFSSDPANYTASADAYVIEDFVFNPTDGVTSVEAVPIPPESTVPEPSTVWLMLLGSLLLLRSAGMGRAVARARQA